MVFLGKVSINILTQGLLNKCYKLVTSRFLPLHVAENQFWDFKNNNMKYLLIQK